MVPSGIQPEGEDVRNFFKLYYAPTMRALRSSAISICKGEAVGREIFWSIEPGAPVPKIAALRRHHAERRP